MVASKIVSESEIVRWLEDGKSYAWMVDQYREKYDLEVSRSLFGNFRRRRGMDPRINRDKELIPWTVEPKHRYAYPLQMLRLIGRVRAGKDMDDRQRLRVVNYLEYLHENDVVIHYEPELEDGFVFTPRRDVDGPAGEAVVRRPSQEL